MGRDKALLRWGEQTVAEHLAAIVFKVAGSICLVGEPKRYKHLGLATIADIRPGTGPLGGLETALSVTEADYNLILACDLPDVPQHLLNELMSVAEGGDWDCVAACDADGRRHPLCAVYRRRCLDRIQHALSTGEYRLLRVLDSLNVHWHQARCVLSNVNTPEEWYAIERP